jgi:hypothetical protein
MEHFIAEQTAKALRKTEAENPSWCPQTGKPTHTGSLLRTCLANHNLVSCCCFDNPAGFNHCPDNKQGVIE